jgi:sulfatase maturation enzyme AslB (radical SAM superfamily)
MRTTWNKIITDAPVVETVDPLNVKFLNLSFGNKCNSRCMTCNSEASNQWLEEEKFIWNKTSDYKKLTHNSNTNLQLIQTFYNATTISFLGGEPTIADEHLEFLKLLIEHRDCSEIQLQYVSNLTNLTDELIECWKNFKAIGLTVSIDGYSKVNDYMRYPFKWDKVDSNLHKYLEQTRIDPKFTINLSCTVSMLNICSVADLIEYYVDSGHKYCQLWKDDQKLPSIILNKVTFPDYLQSNLLPLEYRLQAVERTEQVLKNVRKVTPSVRESLHTLISWLKEPQLVDDILNQKAKHFIQQSDIFRDRNIEDYIPGLVSQL